MLVSPTSDPGTYGRNVGVWYESGARRWAVFNQNRAPVPTGAGFEVLIPQDSVTFLHQADLLNTVGNYTYLDNRLTNGRPDAVLSFTQNRNPGVGTGVYNNHPVDVIYE